MHPTRQFETAGCGGSNLKAPMKLDFLRSLCAQDRHAWPEVVLCRVEGEPLPVCCLSEAAAGDLFSRVGIVSAPSEALTALLQREKADVVVSLYPSESSFIPDIKDGSRKVLELHYCKFFRLQYGRKGLLGLIDRLRTRQDERIVRRFDRFVVLTHEDCGYWGALNNIEVIPNAALHIAEKRSDVSAQRVIAVGRLDYQKGFDRLIQAWELVRQTNKYGGWRLDIFGQGEWQDMLQRMIDRAGLQETAHINRPTTSIGDEYARSSMLVMSSHYEGFPMVMIEAMACGLPVVSFDYKCGPKDIINHGVNGLLVTDGDIEGLAAAMTRLMSDVAYRRKLSANARKVTDTYSEEAVMARWLNLFTSLTEK